MSRDWLALREPADAAARSRELVAQLARLLPANGPRLIHDLGAGTGAMGRWLGPLLPGRQHWVVHDRDVELLAIAAAKPPGRAPDGMAVTVETRRSDITRLDNQDLDGATLITASALLDMLTEHELAAIVDVCAGADCPILLAMSVVGNVTLAPADPLDESVVAAFNDHQRRITERGRLLGPDAVQTAAERLRRHGREVLVRPSPWRLGAHDAELTQTWFTGWAAAAREQRPELQAAIDAYARRRLEQLAAGELAVTIDHADLLALA